MFSKGQDRVHRADIRCVYSVVSRGLLVATAQTKREQENSRVGLLDGSLWYADRHWLFSFRAWAGYRKRAIAKAACANNPLDIEAVNLIEFKKLREDEVLMVLEQWALDKQLIGYKYLNAKGASLQNIDHAIDKALREELTKK